jgi:cytochrome c-type biogenesis protein CcmH/NrfG
MTEQRQACVVKTARRTAEMRNKSLLFISVITTVIAFLLITAPAAAQRGRIAGTIKDKEGNPIVDAEVKFDNSEADTKYDHKVEKTDRNGRFVFTGLRAGTWILTVAAAGYMPFANNYHVSSVSRNEDIVVILEKLTETTTAVNARAEAEEMIGGADKLLAEGKYDEAIAIYNDYLKEHPDFYKIYLLIGDAYFNKGEQDKAIEAFAMVLAQEPENVNALLGTGNAYIRKTEYTKAEEYFLKLAGLRATDPDIMYTLAEIMLESGQTDKAIEYYTKVIELNPKHSYAYMKLGYAYYAEKQWQKAVEQFEKFVEIAPNRPEVQFVKEDIEKCKQKLAEQK